MGLGGLRPSNVGHCGSGCARAQFGRYSKWYGAVRFVAPSAKCTRHQHKPSASKGENSETVPGRLMYLMHTCRLGSNERATQNLLHAMSDTCQATHEDLLLPQSARQSVIGGCWTRRNGGVLAANANRPRSPFQVMHRAAALYSSSSMAPPAQSASMRQTGSDSRPRIARMQWGNSPALPGKSIQGSRSGWAEARSWPQSQLKPSAFGCLKWWQAGAAGPWRGGLPACWVGRAAAFTGVWRQGQRPLFSHRSVSCVARGRFATAARVPRPLFVGQCVLRAVSSFAGTRALLCV